MARKSNKQQQARKQQKQQRRKARTSRREAGYSKPRPASSHLDRDLIADMGPLAQGNTVFPGADMEGLMLSILASEDMANEPELKNIVFDPVRCVNTFAEVGEEMGYTPETLDNLPEDKHEEVQMQILETSIRRVLNDRLQQDILAGLKALRARWRKEGKSEAVARSATVQSFLAQDKTNETWAMLGVVQAIFHRSMMIGFELFEATADVLDSSEAGADDALLLERVNQSSAQKISAVLQEHPEIRGFMEDEADKVWEEGQEAIYTGELDLGLFTEEELQEGVELLKELLGYDETTGELTKGISPTSKEARNVVSHVEDYVAELLTPQRLVQIQERLVLVPKEKAFQKKWFSFVYLFAEDMKAEDAIETQTELLVRIFFGEMRKLSQAQDDTPSEDADL